MAAPLNLPTVLYLYHPLPRRGESGHLFLSPTLSRRYSDVATGGPYPAIISLFTPVDRSYVPFYLFLFNRDVGIRERCGIDRTATAAAPG